MAHGNGPFPAFNGISDASNVRVALIQGARIVSAPATDIGLAAATSITTRNRIVNPAMQISQENGNTAGTTSNYYAADQFFTELTAGTITSQRVQSVTPNGSKDRYRATVTVADASLAAGEYLAIRHPIEGNRVADFRYGSASAKQAILRFGFRAPAGTYAIAVRNSAFNRSYVALFTISAGQANTDTEQTFVIPGDTTGTWLADTGAGIDVIITLATGSSFQGVAGWQAGNFIGTSAVSNGIATAGNVFELFDVGLYLDADATGIPPKWELNSEAFDLWECLRYYQQVGGTTGQPFCPGVFYSTTVAFLQFALSPRMRIGPTFSYSALSDFTIYGVAYALNAISSPSASDHMVRVDVTSGTATTAGAACQLHANNTAARLKFSARM